jgi:hypothetical protein
MAVTGNHRESPRWQSPLPPWPESPTARVRLTRSPRSPVRPVRRRSPRSPVRSSRLCHFHLIPVLCLISILRRAPVVRPFAAFAPICSAN